MFGFHLTRVQRTLLEMGLVKSKRDFSRNYLEHHWSYLRDVEQRNRDEFRVPPATVAVLRERLSALTAFLPKTTAARIEQVIAEIDQHSAVVDALGYRFRRSG